MKVKIKRKEEVKEFERVLDLPKQEKKDENEKKRWVERERKGREEKD